MGSNPVKVLAFITARIIAYLILHQQFNIWNISYITPTFISHWLLRTHKWPAPNVSGFITQLVRASHGYCEGTGSKICEFRGLNANGLFRPRNEGLETRPKSAISNWFSGAKTNRHILIFKLTTGIPKLSANFLMTFIPGTSVMLAVQTRNCNTSYSSQFNCFIVNTLGKLLKALSNINWQCFVSQD